MTGKADRAAADGRLVSSFMLNKLDRSRSKAEGAPLLLPRLVRPKTETRKQDKQEVTPQS